MSVFRRKEMISLKKKEKITTKEEGDSLAERSEGRVKGA